MAVHGKLTRLKKHLHMAIAAKDPRTRKSNSERVAIELNRVDETTHEASLLLRAACLRIGVRGGLQSDPLPTDTVTLGLLVANALEYLPDAFHKTSKKVNPFAVQVAAISASQEKGAKRISRNEWKKAVGGNPTQGKRGQTFESDSVEKNATRLKDAAAFLEVPQGIVAVTVRAKDKK